MVGFNSVKNNLKTLLFATRAFLTLLLFNFKLLSLKIGAYFGVDKVVVLVHIDPGPRGP